MVFETAKTYCADTVADRFGNGYAWDECSVKIPAANVGIKGADQWLPAELLWIEPDQAVGGLLMPAQTSSMIQVARKPPSENLGFITAVARPRIEPNSLQVGLALFS